MRDDGRLRRAVDHDFSLGILAAGGERGGGAQHLVEIERLLVVGLGEGEAAQVLDDFGDARRPLHRALEQRLVVGDDRVDLQAGAQRLPLGRRRVGVNGVEIGEQALLVAIEREDVGVDEADGVVELVRDARHQPAEARHLLLLDQPDLRLLQLDMRFVQRLIGAAQFADRPARQHRADASPVGGELRGAAHRQAFLLAIGGAKAQIDFLHLALAARGEKLGEPALIAFDDECADPRPDEFVFGAADQAHEGGVDLADDRLLADDDQDVGNRGDDAGNERLRLFELGVLALQIRFVAQQLGIDFVHAADDVDPHGFAHAVERKVAPSRHSRDQAGMGRFIPRSHERRA